LRLGRGAKPGVIREKSMQMRELRAKGRIEPFNAISGQLEHYRLLAPSLSMGI